MTKGKSPDTDIYLRRKFEDVRMPEVTYGQCKQYRSDENKRHYKKKKEPTCKVWSDLADGLCMHCWDRSNGQMHNRHSNTGTITG